MPKYSNFPTLFDEVLQLNISKLSKWGCLEGNDHGRYTITWTGTRWGIKEKRGSISILVNMAVADPFVELDYKFNNEPINYKVSIVCTPSNLGKGKIYYFVCPKTFKRCRKLYSIGGYFLHREAFKGCYYESQTRSKKWRQIEKIYGCYFDLESHYQELYQKHFKKFYNGQPTKRYLKLMSKIKQGERIPPGEIERLLLL